MKKLMLGLVIGAFLVLLMGATLTYHTNESKYFDDDCDIYYGTDYDFSMYCDTAGILEIDPLAAGYTLYLGTVYTDAINVKWFSDTDGDFVTFDEENVEVLFTDVDLQLDDDANIYIGAAESTDGVLSWDNSNSEVDLTTATGRIHLTASAVADGSYGTYLTGSMSTATKSEGLGLYVEGNTSGNADGKVYALGAWLNITAGTPTDVPDSLMAAADIGIYAAAAPELAATQIRVLNLEYQIHADAAPVQKTSMMHFNCDAGQDVPDYWFTTGNASAVMYTAETTHSSPNKVGAIKINIGGVGDMYIYVYNDTGA